MKAERCLELYTDYLISGIEKLDLSLFWVLYYLKLHSLGPNTKYHSLYFLSEQKVNKNSPATAKRLKIDYEKLKIKQLAKSSNNLFFIRFL